MQFFRLLSLACLCSVVAPAMGAEPDPKELVKKVITTAGGEEKLLDIFRFRERVLITATPAAPVKPDEKGNRTSVVQVGGDWWIGKDKRDKDKVRVLAWAWSLRILLDPKSKVETTPDITVAEKPAFGLKVTESIKGPITLYFDKKTNQLVAIDYTDTRHIFSDWKKTIDGHQYPSHVVGYRFVKGESGPIQEKQWYQTDILELTPLKELPAELKK